MKAPEEWKQAADPDCAWCGGEGWLEVKSYDLPTLRAHGASYAPLPELEPCPCTRLDPDENKVRTMQ